MHRREGEGPNRVGHGARREPQAASAFWLLPVSSLVGPLVGQSHVAVRAKYPDFRRRPRTLCACSQLSVRSARRTTTPPTGCLSKHRAQTQPAMTQKALVCLRALSMSAERPGVELRQAGRRHVQTPSVNLRNSRHWSQVASELARSQSEYGRTPALGSSELNVKAARISRTNASDRLKGKGTFSAGLCCGSRVDLRLTLLSSINLLSHYGSCHVSSVVSLDLAR